MQHIQERGKGKRVQRVWCLCQSGHEWPPPQLFTCNTYLPVQPVIHNHPPSLSHRHKPFAISMPSAVSPTGHEVVKRTTHIHVVHSTLWTMRMMRRMVFVLTFFRLSLGFTIFQVSPPGISNNKLVRSRICVADTNDLSGDNNARNLLIHWK